jgi:hypothetical protein
VTRKRGGARRPQEPSLPHRMFHSSGALEIRVGRDVTDNHELTFRHSAPDAWTCRARII